MKLISLFSTMRLQWIGTLAAAVLMAALAPAARCQNLVANGSFEALTVSVTSDKYTVNFGTLATNAATGWNFGISGVNNGYNGIATTTGAFGNKVIEDGSYAAFLQGAGTVYQSITLNAGTYILSFYAMGRDASTGGNGVNPVAVTFGGYLSQTITPTNTAQSNLNDWILYTYSFTVTASGTYTLQFSGTLPYGVSGDHTTYIDNVSLSLSPVIPPSIATGPAPLTLYTGSTAKFSVSVNGTAPFSYHWRKNGSRLSDGGNIAGSATNILVVTNISATDAAGYDVVVTNTSGAATSSVAPLALVVPATVYERSVISNGPVAYYRLNEAADPSTGTATVYDYVGGFNGVYGPDVLNGFNNINGPLPSDGFPGFESTNGAAQFTNPDPNSEITAAPWYLNTNTVTMAAWIYPTGTQTPFAALVACRGGGDGSSFNFTGTMDPNGNPTLGYTWNNDGNTWGWDSGIVPPANQWSFAALVVTPTNATVYLINANGLASAQHTYNHAVASFFAPSTIGQDPLSGSRTFNGTIDEVAVFNKALTQGQLAAMFGAGSGITAFAPFISTEPPLAQMLYAHQTARFTVTAQGVPPPAYQWQVGTNGAYVNLANSVRISGATNATLTISNLSLSDPTNYQVEVSNIAGSTNSSSVALTVLPAPAPGTYAGTILAASPVAYYRLNENSDPSSGTAMAFDFAGGFNGIYGAIVENGFDAINGPLPSDGFPGFESTNTAALFTSGYANSEIETPPWNLNANTVTLTAWINPAASQAPFTGLIACVGGNDGSLFNFTGSTDANGNETLGYSWASDYETYSWDSGIAPPDNQWSFVALTVTPTNATVYIINTNGVLTSVHTHNHAVEPFAANSFIGTDPYSPTTRGFGGIIDEVAVFGRALSAGEVSALYDSGAGIITSVALTPAWNGSILTLTWPGGGQLLQSTNVTGPWTTNATATSGFTVTPTGPRMFYRIKMQ
jgi:hypothetical protein